jgi:hypothetical protein
VPIANENRLVVPDALATTIKTASPASWRCTLAWCWPATASETGAVAYIYHLRSYTCFETCWSPSRASDQRTRLPLATASGGLGARLRNLSAAGGSLALAGTPNADYERLPGVSGPQVGAFRSARSGRGSAARIRVARRQAARWPGLGVGEPRLLAGASRAELNPEQDA